MKIACFVDTSHMSIRRGCAYFLSIPQEMSSMLLTGKRFWNRSFHSWFLPWQPASFPLPASCPHQTMRHQLTWSSARRQSRLPPSTHCTKGIRPLGCSRSNRLPDQVDLVAALLPAARPGCCPWLVEYRNVPAAPYAPGVFLCALLRIILPAPAAFL